jgi:hypothetical protein
MEEGARQPIAFRRINRAPIDALLIKRTVIERPIYFIKHTSAQGT